ncbi:acetyl-CoA synthetase-like protein [Xylaria sp. CBS 124048]|nr:acetyl-CoA synthetase-like protein [Xylaria sp. CBS 124048]
MATVDEHRSRCREHSMPDVVDKRAREDPDAVYGIWPVQPDSYSAGVRTITYLQLANIVNGLAWAIVKKFGPSENKDEVLAYVGPNDVRFTALVLAGIKTGYSIFFTSPRNSPEAHRKLFERLQCHKFIASDLTQQLALGVLRAVLPMHSTTIPSVDELISTWYPPYKITKRFHESFLDPLFIIHTSGSTGIPKPLIWTQETVIRHLVTSFRASPEGEVSRDSLVRGKRILTTLPSFHGAGLIQYFLNAIPSGAVPIVPAIAASIVTAQGVVDALKQTPADVAIMVPSVVAELAQNPELLDYCARNLQCIFYVGGDLPDAIGDRVAAKIPLRCWWGASEVSVPHQLIVPGVQQEPGGWRYIRFHPHTGAVFEDMGNGVYELVIRRLPDTPHTDPQPTFSIRGNEELQEYRTRDLFQPHPSVPNAWRWCGRADDIIVFLNGEKTNPNTMEQYVLAKNQDRITGVIVIGAQRFQAALVIEPTRRDSLTTVEEAALIEQVWPSVEEGNKSAPGHARIEKSLILVANKPFIRSGKGTIQRGSTISQYKADIDKLYTNADLSVDVVEDGEFVHGSMPKLTDVNDVAELIRDTVREITGWPEMNDDASFFDSGMDSLQALRLVRAMRKALYRPSLALSTVYQNPTAPQLAAAILSESQNGPDDMGIAEQLLTTYRGLIQQIPRPTPLSSQSDEVARRNDIILTGSTGTLGTSILTSLLRRPGTGHVFCLNRGADGGRATQHERFIAQKLETNVLSDRVTFLKADLADPTLGLDAGTHEMLRERVRLVIHNAWPVNFNLALCAFRPQLAGLVNIFAFAAERAIRTFFVSSIGAVYGTGSNPAEESIPDGIGSFNAPMVSGYSRSKLLAELLCDSAARHLGLSVTVLRYGQIAGSTAEHGTVWNRSEWLPSLAISSLLSLNCLPDSLGPRFSEIDWVPSDLAGAAVADFVQDTDMTPDQSPRDAEVLNVRNPQTTSWDALIPAIQEAAQMRLGHTMEMVPPAEWLSRLRRSEKTDTDMEFTKSSETMLKNPAIKLLDFYSGVLWPGEAETATRKPMVVQRSVSRSPTLRNMPATSPDWMRKWVLEWVADTTVKEL